MKIFNIKYSRMAIDGSAVAILMLLLIGTGCKKGVDIGPPVTQLSGTNVYSSNLSAQSVLAGLYDKIAASGGSFNGGNGISILEGLAADELSNSNQSTNLISFYTNTMNIQSYYYWADLYQNIYICNSAIKGISESSAITSPNKELLLGQAKFLRAFLYFYAVNLYGNVPLSLTTDYTVNNVILRSPQPAVYQQIIQDLKDAQSLLPDNAYLSLKGVASIDRTIANKQAASALLARVYLYSKDWQNAETQASSVIAAPLYTLESNLSNVFLKTSKEAILQLQPISVNYNNADAIFLVVTQRPGGSATQFPLSNSLLSAFEPGDTRLTNWVGVYNAPASGTQPATPFYFAYKYKSNVITSGTPVTEYPIMIRLAEVYLIRAEARAQQNNLSGATTDLNAIRSRASLSGTTATTQTTLLTAIQHERQVELFTEQGHRWFDLKRTGTVDAVMSVETPKKGGTWSSYEQLLPVPVPEILLNKNLGQNPGY